MAIVVAGLGEYVNHGLTDTPVVTRPEGDLDYSLAWLFVGFALLAEDAADPIPSVTGFPASWFGVASPVTDDTDVARALQVAYKPLSDNETEVADYTFNLSAPSYTQTGALIVYEGILPNDNFVGETAEGTGGVGARVPEITTLGGRRLLVSFGFAPATGYAFGNNGTVGGYTTGSPPGSSLYQIINLPAGTVIPAETDDASVTTGWLSCVFELKDNTFHVVGVPPAARLGQLGE